MLTRPVPGLAAVPGERGTVALSSTTALIGAIGRARSVTLEAYALHPGALVRSLERAAAVGGADVHVVLCPPYSDPKGEIAKADEAAQRELRASGVDVVTSQPYDHLKAAIVDGRLYLDDRNWTRGGHETVIVDSRPEDVAAARATVAGGPSWSTPTFATRKVEALRLEADLIASRAPTLDVESENFGESPMVEALEDAAKHGHVRLIVSQRDVYDKPEKVATLKRLQHDGVEIHLGAYAQHVGTVGNEKFCVAGERAWLGSANATWWGSGDQADWGLRTSDSKIVGSLHARFADDWQNSGAFVA